jgi:hypothetical protein
MSRSGSSLLSPAFFILFFLIPSAQTLAQELTGRVIDENGGRVAGARVTLTLGLVAPVSALSDDAGRFQFVSLAPGIYELRAEKEGYYATISHALKIEEHPAPLEVVLNHQQEYEEKVDVIYSAPVIDRQQAAATNALTAQQIVDLPVVATHDYRNALPLMSGIIKDNNGDFHLNGGGDHQVYYSLDGFNITAPVSGTLDNRLSVDAIRALRIETSRYSAEYGKGSAGVMALESSQGDDRLRFSATNFFPGLGTANGLEISNWTPRVTISGPIVKGRAWFYNASDLQYNLNTIPQLPEGDNSSTDWIGSNLTRLQVNLTNRNILTGEFLLNFRNSANLGISPLDPVETTHNLHDRIYFYNLKDRAFLGNWVVETGAGRNQIDSLETPQGNQIYVISPQGREGNYYLQSQSKATRTQLFSTALPPFINWHGKHSLKFGLEGDRITYEQLSNRGSLETTDSTGAITRFIRFQGNPRFGRNNAELSGYLQDSWTVNGQVMIDSGIRLDWDEVLRQPLWSPRFAFTWAPSRLPNSKFSGGVGVFYDVTNLALMTQAQDQERLDVFYGPDGVPLPGGPVITRFAADERDLKAPYYLNWSVGWQQKVAHGFYVQSNFVRKNGRSGWAYDLGPPTASVPGQFTYRLASTRTDSYSYAEVELSRTFRGKYPWMISYARSDARASEVVSFSLDNPIFARQAAGPLDWDSPNRLISWAVIPIPRFQKYALAYFAEWHSGTPWSQVNQFQQLIGLPNASRFPDYFSLNLHLERRFRFLHFEWALRAGFNNITGHENPTVVINNIDAANFGLFSGSQGRVFTGRIRFLGRN